MIAIGKVHKEYVVNDDGVPEIKDVCDFGITVDQRIANGFYFIESLKYFNEIFKHPEMLEEEISKEIKLTTE
jgi:pyruvate/2-oxoglutarate dehydrogenase complex dihydrolipoamide acyltransferase (E2) component